MNYLELVNATLIRLREETVDAGNFLSTPFYKLIGACVNDAKHSVEDAWQWTQLRGQDQIAVVPDQRIVTLPDSAEGHYVIKTILNVQKANFLNYITTGRMKQYYANEANVPVASNVPGYWSFYIDEAGTRNKQISIYPPANDFYTLATDRTQHQDDLTAWDDDLLVPPRPVYLLAAALSAQERGEVGGSPVGNLFQLADQALSDAIAYDTSRVPEEMIWSGSNNVPNQTNNKGY